jgi:aerobic carbon-monoxide dehydrogenase small subunit
MKRIISFTLNGDPYECAVAPYERLLDLIRDGLGLTGTKEGCGEGECGACTVIVNGQLVNACLVLAPQVDGADILTIEGLALRGELSVLQRTFVDFGAVQCGFCSPGMIMTAKALLDSNPWPTEADIRTALAGNLCRCTGYQKITQAVMEAARLIRERSPADPPPVAPQDARVSAQGGV